MTNIRQAASTAFQDDALARADRAVERAAVETPTSSLASRRV